MPWTASDMAKKSEKLNGKAAGIAATVANKALKTCLDKIEGTPSDEQRSKCEASAIKQGLAVGGRMGEGGVAVAEIAQSAIEAARSFVSGGKELVEATGQSPKLAMNALLDSLQGELDAALAKLKAATEEYLESYEEAEDMKSEQSEAEAVAVTPEMVRGVLKFLWTRFGDEGEEEEKPAVPERGAEEAEADADEMAEAELAESSAVEFIGLAEDIAATAQKPITPLKLNVAIIQPGWGNAKDGHYYPAETLHRDSARVFPGIKMHESDHRDDEKSTRTWVSTVDEIIGFTENGAPIGRVSVHDKSFAERLLALNRDDKLHLMECSILGTGKVRKGEIDGRKGKIVEAITDARNVDWVTRGGAGGHALNLAETDGGDEMTEEHKEQEQAQEEEAREAEVTMLSEEAVTAILSESTLPDAAQAKLGAAEYKDEEAVNGAIAAEVKYLEEITDAGKPKMHSDREEVKAEPMSEAEDKAAIDAIWQSHGLEPLYGGVDNG